MVCLACLELPEARHFLHRIELPQNVENCSSVEPTRQLARSAVVPTQSKLLKDVVIKLVLRQQWFGSNENRRSNKRSRQNLEVGKDKSQKC